MEPTLTYKCERCARPVSYKMAQVGRKGRCKGCQNTFLLPGPNGEADAGDVDLVDSDSGWGESGTVPTPMPPQPPIGPFPPIPAGPHPHIPIGSFPPPPIGPQPQPKPQPRRDNGPPPEIDRTPSLRRGISRYFVADLSGAMLMFALAIPMVVFTLGIGICFVPIPIIMGLAIIAYQLYMISSEEEVTECIREDRRELEKAALRRIHDVIDAVPADGQLPGWEEPLLFVGPTLVLEDPHDTVNLQVRVTKGKRLRVARSNAMVVVLGTYQLVTYRIAIDHRTGQVYEDSLKEIFYQDVVTADSTTKSFTYATGLTAYLAHNPHLYLFLKAIVDPPVVWPWKIWYRLLNPLYLPVKLLSWLLRGARSEVVVEQFTIQADGETRSRVGLRFEYIDDATFHQGALTREDGAEELAIRNRLREVKVLMRRDK